ncbi:MAG TPA: sulfite exporter TauE/SafE family protein [Candidatus Limnocylindrales bacterium]|nr:sulfite exporter TauE/SafE family protein [Candidatus Limnocylindrales bacterium]
MDSWLLMLIVGLAAGVLSGMFGIGGGVVIVPVLVTLGFGLQEAIGTSLAALLMPVGTFAAIAYYRAGKLKIGIALWVALGLAAGAILGAQIALGLDTELLQKAYALFLLFAGWRFAEPRKWLAERRASEPPPSVPDSEPLTTSWYVMLALGFGAGILSGLFGVGGGIIIVPALVGILHFDQKMASGTSLGALLLPVGLGAALSYYNAGLLDVNAAIFVALGLTIGALGGARLALGMQSKTVKRLYGLFLLVVAFRFLFF